MTLRTVTVGMLLLAACGSSDGDSSAKGSAGSGSDEFGNAPPQQFGNAGQNGGGPQTPRTPVTSGGGNGGVCEVVHLDAKPSTPDMLIVLDRSGSMGDEGRWVPSATAVRTIVDGLESQIQFGLALFPDPASVMGNNTVVVNNNNVQIDPTPCLSDPDPLGCIQNLLADAGINVNTATGGGCAPGKIVVPVGLNSAAAIGAALDMTGPAGGTPTPETLQGLVDEYAAPVTDPDAVLHPKFILLVTDGQPTCPSGGGTLTLPPDIDASNVAIEMLTARGVRTYVIGYNTTGPGNEQLAAVLDGFAMRGGTGDTQHRPVEDEQSLLTEFRRIAGVAISCTFVLEKAPARPDYVLVRVDGTQVNLNDPNGWQLVDERTIELRGNSCTMLQADGNHTVDAEVRCEVVAPL